MLPFCQAPPEFGCFPFMTSRNNHHRIALHCSIQSRDLVVLLRIALLYFHLMLTPNISDIIHLKHWYFMVPFFGASQKCYLDTHALIGQSFP